MSILEVPPIISRSRPAPRGIEQERVVKPGAAELGREEEVRVHRAGSSSPMVDAATGLPNLSWLSEKLGQMGTMDQAKLVNLAAIALQEIASGKPATLALQTLEDVAGHTTKATQLLSASLVKTEKDALKQFVVLARQHVDRQEWDSFSLAKAAGVGIENRTQRYLVEGAFASAAQALNSGANTEKTMRVLASDIREVLEPLPTNAPKNPGDASRQGFFSRLKQRVGSLFVPVRGKTGGESSVASEPQQLESNLAKKMFTFAWAAMVKVMPKPDRLLEAKISENKTAESPAGRPPNAVKIGGNGLSPAVAKKAGQPTPLLTWSGTGTPEPAASSKPPFAPPTRDPAVAAIAHALGLAKQQSQPQSPTQKLVAPAAIAATIPPFPQSPRRDFRLESLIATRTTQQVSESPAPVPAAQNIPLTSDIPGASKVADQVSPPVQDAFSPVRDAILDGLGNLPPRYRDGVMQVVSDTITTLRNGGRFDRSATYDALLRKFSEAIQDNVVSGSHDAYAYNPSTLMVFTPKTICQVIEDALPRERTAIANVSTKPATADRRSDMLSPLEVDPYARVKPLFTDRKQAFGTAEELIAALIAQIKSMDFTEQTRTSLTGFLNGALTARLNGEAEPRDRAFVFELSTLCDDLVAQNSASPHLSYLQAIGSGAAVYSYHRGLLDPAAVFDTVVKIGERKSGKERWRRAPSTPLLTPRDRPEIKIAS